ncbi:Tetratricopeptide TPR_1 repeat-containing protein [[Leptolyngbya] sp. PCC 7376]|uniref:tetratricopeptide repeat protein n=1 Tax=[Leptolyngbya] sp. PCC 7376 TaxID=111781 RepID=UPI00029F2E65|nr:tetratricopeptide repeat protein [[Leptolyngbya] sp. PCC 7376]AFY37583.1 Tetratricopeptide TPR_1 repeat-containing protein [[Leptolyngbya] sp. PCC 7376]
MDKNDLELTKLLNEYSYYLEENSRLSTIFKSKYNKDHPLQNSSSKKELEEHIVEFSHLIYQVLRHRDKVEDALSSYSYLSPHNIDLLERNDQALQRLIAEVKIDHKANKKTIDKVKFYSRRIKFNPCLEKHWWKFFYDKPWYIFLNLPSKTITLICLFFTVLIIYRNISVIESFGFGITDILTLSFSGLATLSITASFFKVTSDFLKNIIREFPFLKAEYHEQIIAVFSFLLLLFLLGFILLIPLWGRNALRVGDSLYTNGQYKKAEQQYQKAATYLNKDNFAGQNIFKTIPQYFDFSFETKQHPLILFKLGKTYYKMLNLNKAQEYFQKAIALESNKSGLFYTDYLTSLAKIYIIDGYGVPSISAEGKISYLKQEEINNNLTSAKYLLDTAAGNYSSFARIFSPMGKYSSEQSICVVNYLDETQTNHSNKTQQADRLSKLDDYRLYIYEQSLLSNEEDFKDLANLQSCQDIKNLSTIIEYLDLFLKYRNTLINQRFTTGLYSLLGLQKNTKIKDIKSEHNPTTENRTILKETVTGGPLNFFIALVNESMFWNTRGNEILQEKLLHLKLAKSLDTTQSLSLKLDDDDPIKREITLFFQKVSLPFNDERWEQILKALRDTYKTRARSLPKGLELSANSSSLCFYRFSQFVYEVLGEEKTDKFLIQKPDISLNQEISQVLGIDKSLPEGDQKDISIEKEKEALIGKVIDNLFDKIYAKLEEQLVGSVCYGDDNRPISSLEPYEANIIYQLRRVPGFPKNPS